MEETLEVMMRCTIHRVEMGNKDYNASTYLWLSLSPANTLSPRQTRPACSREVSRIEETQNKHDKIKINDYMCTAELLEGFVGTRSLL
jgi:hypothetical protein